MKLCGYQLIIAFCLAVELTSIIWAKYLIEFLQLTSRLSLIIGFGILFLIYPLLGHLVDVYLTRYHTLKASYMYIILTIQSCATVVYRTVNTISSLVFKYKGAHSPPSFSDHFGAYYTSHCGVGLVWSYRNSVWARSTAGVSHTKTDLIHPLVLLESECGRIGCVLCSFQRFSNISQRNHKKKIK